MGVIIGDGLDAGLPSANLPSHTVVPSVVKPLHQTSTRNSHQDRPGRRPYVTVQGPSRRHLVSIQDIRVAVSPLTVLPPASRSHRSSW